MFLNLSQTWLPFAGQHLSVIFKSERSTQGWKPYPGFSLTNAEYTATVTSTAPSPAGYALLDTGQNTICLKSQLAYKPVPTWNFAEHKVVWIFIFNLQSSEL